MDGSEGAAEDLHSGLRRAVSMLLEAMSLNAVRYNPRELAQFLTTIDGFRAQFESARDAATVRGICGSAARTLEIYASSAERFHLARREQARKSITSLTDTVILVSRCGCETAEMLRVIRNEMENAADAEELTLLNARLNGCLQKIAEEASAGRRQAAEEDGRDPQGGGPVAWRSPAAESSLPAADGTGGRNLVDPVTGLPSAQSGVEAIRAALERPGRPGYILSFSLERVQAINLRFGYKVGDQILVYFAQYLAQELNPEDSLFRWRGPGFFVLSGREGNERELTATAKKIGGSKLTHSIAVGDREISVPLASTWKLVALSEFNDVDGAVMWLDDLSAGMSTEAQPVRRRMSRP